jgi:hypothetical protein
MPYNILSSEGLPVVAGTNQGGGQLVTYHWAVEHVALFLHSPCRHTTHQPSTRKACKTDRDADGHPCRRRGLSANQTGFIITLITGSQEFNKFGCE